jgi:hypothetical protein
MSDNKDDPAPKAPEAEGIKRDHSKPESVQIEAPPTATTSAPAIEAVQPLPPSEPPKPTLEPPKPPSEAPAIHYHLPNQAPASKVDVWSTRLSAWAQILTVFVVIFGYFYTVRPAFQLSLLQEQAAQLQLDNDSAKRKLARTEADESQAQLRLNAVTAELARVSKDLDRARADSDREASQALDAAQKMVYARTQLASQTGNLQLAQRRLLYTRFAGAFNWGLRWGVPPYIGTDDEDGSSFAVIQAAWLDPYQVISGALDQLEKNNASQQEFPPELVQPLRRTLEEKKKDLVCETPPLDSLAREYREDVIAMKVESRRLAIEELEKQRLAALANKQRMIVTDADIDRFAKIHEIGRSYEIRRKYEEKIQALWEACKSKGKAVLDQLYKQI